MRMRHRSALFTGAILAAVGWVGGANAAPVTTSTSPITIDGWTISWPTAVNLSVSQDSSTATQVDLQKSITVNSPGQGFQISFAPGANATADTFVIDTESITNNSGSAFGGFSFILLNTGSVDATFGGSTPGFKPPTGTGYDYTSVMLVNTKTELDYVGTQNNGVTSVWGNGDASSAGDNLVIDAPAGSSFSLKELAVPGGPTPPPAVPVPASLWQSLAGLTGLGLIAGLRTMKRRTTA